MIATARVYNQTENETYGQFVPFTIVQSPIKINESQYLIHLSQNESFSTNLGLSEISGEGCVLVYASILNNLTGDAI